jgi:hypothetical protein
VLMVAEDHRISCSLHDHSIRRTILRFQIHLSFKSGLEFDQRCTNRLRAEPTVPS